MSLNDDIVVGWPGLYWLEKTSNTDLEIPKHIYYCNINNNEIHQTHAIVRALNWWNDLYTQLNTVSK